MKLFRKPFIISDTGVVENSNKWTWADSLSYALVLYYHLLSEPDKSMFGTVANGTLLGLKLNIFASRYNQKSIFWG